MRIYDQENEITLFNGGTQLQQTPGVWHTDGTGLYRDFQAVNDNFKVFGTLHQRTEPVTGCDVTRGKLTSYEVELILEGENVTITVPHEKVSIIGDDDKCRDVITAGIDSYRKSDHESM